MEVALSQLIKLVPDLAPTLREEIRSGRLSAERKTGMAGRPYMIQTEEMASSEIERIRDLAEKVEQMGEVPVRRRQRRTMVEEAARELPGLIPGSEMWFPLIKMMESQRVMLEDLVESLTQEMGRRNSRMDNHEREVQELSYKLGQAHQEIVRLESELAGKSLARAE